MQKYEKLEKIGEGMARRSSVFVHEMLNAEYRFTEFNFDSVMRGKFYFTSLS